MTMLQVSQRILCDIEEFVLGETRRRERGKIVKIVYFKLIVKPK